MSNKIFGIYDLNVMPHSIGDIVTFIAAIQTVRYRNNFDYYDICFIANNKQCKENLFNDLITNHNHLHYFQKLVDTIQINNSVKSIYYCNDYEEFYELYQLKRISNFVWPELPAINNKEYLHYRIYNELHKFNQEYRFIPNIFNSDFLTKWAFAFFEKHTGDAIPITINIRNNKLFSEHRNARLDAWLDFFSYCREKYPVKFVLICAKSEIDQRYYEFANVLVAKSLDTTISQEISLIANSSLHLGSASGPATICPFVNHPSLLLNADVLPHINLYNGALVPYRDDKHVRLSFSKELQYYSTFPETADYLIDEFEKLWNAVDVEAWKQVSQYWLDYKTEAPLSWLD